MVQDMPSRMRPTLIDRYVADAMERLSSLAVLESAFDVLVHPLAWVPLLGGLALYLARRGTRQTWALLLSIAVVTIGSQLLVGTILGGLWMREAPNGVGDAGYLSAHVFNAFCLSTLIGRAYREVRPLVRVMAWGVAFAQLFTMSHWFLDVALAAVLGSWLGFVVYRSQSTVMGFLATPAAPNQRVKRSVTRPGLPPPGNRWPAQDPFSKR